METKMTNPDWLAQHEGEARTSKDGHSLTVFFAGKPQYLLMLAPTAGKIRLQGGAVDQRQTPRRRGGVSVAGGGIPGGAGRFTQGAGVVRPAGRPDWWAWVLTVAAFFLRVFDSSGTITVV